MKQLTFPTLGGDIVTVQQRGKHYVQPRGYAYTPGTGPAAETCGTCAFALRGRHYAKCGKARGIWTHSRRTDILLGSPACRHWEASKPENTADQSHKRNS